MANNFVSTHKAKRFQPIHRSVSDSSSGDDQAANFKYPQVEENANASSKLVADKPVANNENVEPDSHHYHPSCEECPSNKPRANIDVEKIPLVCSAAEPKARHDKKQVHKDETYDDVPKNTSANYKKDYAHVSSWKRKVESDNTAGDSQGKLKKDKLKELSGGSPEKKSKPTSSMSMGSGYGTGTGITSIEMVDDYNHSFCVTKEAGEKRSELYSELNGKAEQWKKERKQHSCKILKESTNQDIATENDGNEEIGENDLKFIVKYNTLKSSC